MASRHARRGSLTLVAASVIVTALVVAGGPLDLMAAGPGPVAPLTPVVPVVTEVPVDDASVASRRSAQPPDESRHVGREVPDVLVRTSAGALRLSDLWTRGPVVLSLVFARCAGVCSPYLRALRAADASIGSPSDLRRVVLSFDPRDTVADMEDSARHLGVFGLDGWTFGVADPADVDRLIDALGFWFTWDDGRQQFDHPAMLAGIRRGRVARLLIGESVTPARLAEVVREGRGEFVASYPLPNAARWRCFDYDPATGLASLSWGALILIVPALAAVMLTLGLFRRSAFGVRS